MLIQVPCETAAFECEGRRKERGVFVVPVVFPAVPQDARRVRTCMTAGLRGDELAQALEVFAAVGVEPGVIG